MSKIKVVKYKYKVGDLIKFRIYNGNADLREEIVGVVVKRRVQDCFWHEEAERKVFHSGRDFLIYEAAYESTIYTIRESEVLRLISSKPD